MVNRNLPRLNEEKVDKEKNRKAKRGGESRLIINWSHLGACHISRSIGCDVGSKGTGNFQPQVHQSLEPRRREGEREAEKKNSFIKQRTSIRREVHPFGSPVTVKKKTKGRSSSYPPESQGHQGKEKPCQKQNGLQSRK